MTDHDTIPPEVDDELRARLQAFAADAAGRVDPKTALQRVPRRARRRTIQLVSIAACLLAVVSLPMVLSDRGRVDTVDEADEPDQPGDCPGTTQAAAMDPGAHMKSKLATPVATAAAAMLLLSACSDGDGPRLLARGDVQFVGSDGLAGQKLDIDVSEDDGEVTGEARFNQVVLGLGCTDVRDGALLLGGEVTTPSGDGTPAVGERIAVVIRDGDPDRVALWPGQDLDGTCEELLAEITDEVLADESIYADVEGDGDIETSLDD